MPDFSNSTTIPQLKWQWTNPSDVLSILMIIGGDIVQKALGQSSGGWFTPVCFSFGWVAYSFSVLVNIVGDGRLLPSPDYPAKVFNLSNGYMRENKHWVVGRLLRDNEVYMNKKEKKEKEREQGCAMRIAIYSALDQHQSFAQASRGIIRVFWLLTTLMQLGISAIPLGLDGEWGIFLITSAGMMAALIAGSLPQWKVEKLPTRQKSKKVIAITSGNGARDIIIIDGKGVALDLEELAAAESPRTERAWESNEVFSRPVFDETGHPAHHRNGIKMRRAMMWKGLPIGFWLTRLVCVLQAVFWIALLVTVAGLKSHTWYLLAVGGLGMFQNALVAGLERSPARRGLPMVLVDKIIGGTVMDALMDLEVTIPGAGRALLDEFFGDRLFDSEVRWWENERTDYDNRREEEQMRRSTPRSRDRPVRDIGVKIENSTKGLIWRAEGRAALIEDMIRKRRANREPPSHLNHTNTDDTIYVSREPSTNDDNKSEIDTDGENKEK